MSSDANLLAEGSRPAGSGGSVGLWIACAAATLLLAAGSWAAWGWVTLPPVPSDAFLSSYPAVDHRLLLLRYASLVAACILGPSTVAVARRR